MIDGLICTRSLNAASWLCYCNSQDVLVVENETGLLLFAFENIQVNKEIYDKYKNAIYGNGDRLFVDIVKFQKILRHLKNLLKKYKNERMD